MSIQRPVGIAALSLFFTLGVLISAASAVSLVWRGSALDAMWRINPRALDGFLAMGPWAPVLLVAAAVACGAAGLGLWRFRRWGHRLAVAILAINAVGDTANAAFGGDRRAAIGIPIAIALVAYLLTAHVRSTFAVVPDRFRSPRHAVRGDS